MFLSLYKTLVRPLLEYCVHAWSPHLKRDINLLENVQRRATRIVRVIRDKEYEDRLAFLELPKLEDRRKRGDMILTYRLIHGEEGIGYEKFFELSTGVYNLRGDHSLKIKRPFIPGGSLEPRRHFFSQRVIQNWNNLTEKEVSAKNTSKFKEFYDQVEKLRK